MKTAVTTLDLSAIPIAQSSEEDGREAVALPENMKATC